MPVNNDSSIKARAEANLTEIRGIFPTDLVIQKALEIGIKDLRDNPAQLNYVFAWLLADDSTSDSFGQKERENAINWFNKTNIPVLSDIRLASDTFPSVSYSLMSDEQTEETLSDLNYETKQNVPAEWEPISPSFSPTYDPATGFVSAPQSLTIVPVTTDMFLVTGQGKVYSILSVIDTGFYITSGLTVNLRNSVLKYNPTRLATGIESCNFKKVIRIGCHSIGDARYALYLHSIVKYVLLRYRKTLLEGRGLERTTISSGPVARNELFPVENLFTCYITLVGHARDSWASVQGERVMDVAGGDISDRLKFSPVGTNTDSTSLFIAEPNMDDPSYLAMDVTGARTV